MKQHTHQLDGGTIRWWLPFNSSPEFHAAIFDDSGHQVGEIRSCPKGQIDGLIETLTDEALDYGIC